MFRWIPGPPVFRNAFVLLRFTRNVLTRIVNRNLRIHFETQQAAKTAPFVILSEAKNLSAAFVAEQKREILRFAQNDKQSLGLFFRIPPGFFAMLANLGVGAEWDFRFGLICYFSCSEAR